MPDSAARAARASRMRSFYEPAWFGQGTRFGELLNIAPNLPTTMGGFSYTGSGNPEQPTLSYRDQVIAANKGIGASPEESELMMRDFRTRQLFDRPPIGPQNLDRYGVGQLKNYGAGALTAYGPLVREHLLRWR